MIIEVRTYTLRLGAMREFLALYAAEGRAPRLGRRLWDAQLWHTLDTELTASEVYARAERNLAGVLYLFLRGMSGEATPVVGEARCGVYAWRPPPGLVARLSDVLDGREAP